MQFFIGSIGQPGEGYDSENFDRCIKYNGHFMHEDTKMKGVFDKVDVGAIFFLKYNNNLIAYGEVKSKTKQDNSVLGKWNYIVYVDKWHLYDELNPKNGVNNYGVSYDTIQGGGQMATIKEVTIEYGTKKVKEINGNNELFNRIQAFLTKPMEAQEKVMNENGKEIEKMIEPNIEKVENIETRKGENSSEINKVELQTRTLGQIFRRNQDEHIELPLTIPDYQRIYCWSEKNVHKLLNDIVDSGDNTYHLGSVILHRTSNDQKLAIVDGQQRLVTLSLLLLQLNNDDSPLLTEKFESAEAQAYIAYNKTVIKNFVDRHPNMLIVDKIFKNLSFSVLIINDDSLDLAYTFFSNQNSRGKSLTDYDLLKAHHLRFVHTEKQATHLAERWDNLLLQSENNASDKELGRTLGIYLFRLRKWMRKKQWSEDQKFKVKNEFEAMITIPDIPPFGEKFHYYESIQGGSHFFAYADHFIFKFRVFANTDEFMSLRALDSESHWWYKDVIETMLFAYYLKFNTIYLCEALYCIEQLISDHRFGLGRSSLRSVLEHGGNSEIVMMIDQATSPTFFLAECMNKIQKQSRINDENLKPIQKRYRNSINSIHTKIQKNMCVETFVQLTNKK